jgi:hypothetical protein
LIVLVDTNVLLDIFTNDPAWGQWSLAQMNDLSLRFDLAINDIVYAELCAGFETFEEADRQVDAMALQVRAMPRAALFLAQRAFGRYRTAGGTRTGVLPDFFIGAQAAVESLPLLTRDARRYRTYFPDIKLIAP